MKTAVLVIDVQRVLCSGPDEVFESRRVLERANHVIGLARTAGAPVIVVQHEEPGDMEYGSEGWQLDPRLQALPTDGQVRKTTADSFYNTDLQAQLQARGIGRLVVCGVQSDFCIDTTVRRALALGYGVALVADGHSTVDSGALTAAQISAHHSRTLSRLGGFAQRVELVPAAQVQIGG